MALQELNDGNPSGCRMGSAATEKNSFWGATPVVQPTAATAVSTTAPVAISSGFGFATTAQLTALITAVNLLISNNATTGLDG